MRNGNGMQMRKIAILAATAIVSLADFVSAETLAAKVKFDVSDDAG